MYTFNGCRRLRTAQPPCPWPNTGYDCDQVEKAIYCGEPVVDKLDGGKSILCEHHYARYMVALEDARPEGRSFSSPR
jgi:hypothetical protein